MGVPVLGPGGRPVQDREGGQEVVLDHTAPGNVISQFYSLYSFTGHFTFGQEEKKSVLGLFGKNTAKKIFLPEGSTKETAQFLARMIEELRTCGDNYEPVFMKMIKQKNK